MKKKLPQLPVFKTDKQAEDFVAKSDLTKYDLSGGRFVQFEFEKKAARVTMRLPEPLLQAVRETARKRGIPYQRFIREALEKALLAA